MYLTNRFVPGMNASKQVLFLNELEEILEICRSEQFSSIQHDVYRLLEACLSSEHFQVVLKIVLKAHIISFR